MEILFGEERMPGKGIVELMQKAGELCVSGEGFPSQRVSVSVTFVSSEEIKELNRIYRNKDEVTDVLSFPQYDDLRDAVNQEEILLGDVVICTEQALLQADDFGHAPERELVYLFVHSLYHLMGYDHMEETGQEEMRQLEEGIMQQLGLQR